MLNCKLGLTVAATLMLAACGGPLSNEALTGQTSGGGTSPSQTTPPPLGTALGTSYAAMMSRLSTIQSNPAQRINSIAGVTSQARMSGHMGLLSTPSDLSIRTRPNVVGKADVAVDFATGTVTGSATDFQEVVINFPTPAPGTPFTANFVATTSDLAGAVTITGTASPTEMQLGATGTLTGTITQGGTPQAGTMNINTSGMRLTYLGETGTFSQGGGNVSGLIARGGSPTTGVTFTPDSGGTTAIYCGLASCSQTSNYFQLEQSP